jgi:hypothetical protein
MYVCIHNSYFAKRLKTTERMKHEEHSLLVTYSTVSRAGTKINATKHLAIFFV